MAICTLTLWVATCSFAIAARCRVRANPSLLRIAHGPGIAALSIATFVTLRYVSSDCLEAIIVGIALAALVICGWTDAQVGAIYDCVTLPAFVTIVTLSLVDGRAGIAIPGSLAAAAALMLLHVLTGGRGLGLGDVKLAGVIGAFLGMLGGFIALGTAFFIGAVVGLYLIGAQRADRRSEIRFGPFLATGACIAFLLRSAS